MESKTSTSLGERLYNYVVEGTIEPVDKSLLFAVADVQREECDVLIYKLTSKVIESIIL